MRSAECGMRSGSAEMNNDGKSGVHKFGTRNVEFGVAFHIPHSALRVPHLSIHTPHSALRIPNSKFRILHSEFRICLEIAP